MTHINLVILVKIVILFFSLMSIGQYNNYVLIFKEERDFKIIMDKYCTLSTIEANIGRVTTST